MFNPMSLTRQGLSRCCRKRSNSSCHSSLDKFIVRRAAAGGREGGERCHRVRPYRSGHRRRLDLEHDQGMKAVQAAFPKAKTLFVESIPFSADATRTFTAVRIGRRPHGVRHLQLWRLPLRRRQALAGRCLPTNADGRKPLDNLSAGITSPHWYPTYVHRRRRRPDEQERQARLCRLVPGSVGLLPAPTRS